MAASEDKQARDPPDHANVVVKPPLLFCGALVLGSILTPLLPVGPGLARGNALALVWGVGLAALGLILTGWSVREMVHAGTEVPPNLPSTAIVTTGPYSITRNPIYVGLILLYLGISVALTSLWILLLLPIVLIILHKGVILREEAYLERKFGETYLAYKRRVPRWL